jgi:hypothetical protein
MDTRPARPCATSSSRAVDDLKARAVAFQSLTEAMNTATPTGRALWPMVGRLAALARSRIQERTKAGRAAATARGGKKGRKPFRSAPQIAHARQLIEQRKHPDAVASSLKVSQATSYRALRGLFPVWDAQPNPWSGPAGAGSSARRFPRALVASVREHIRSVKPCYGIPVASTHQMR